MAYHVASKGAGRAFALATSRRRSIVGAGGDPTATLVGGSSQNGRLGGQCTAGRGGCRPM